MKASIESWRVLDGAGRPVALHGNDRGLAYGDGLFETMRVHAGRPVWWREHWQRLVHGASVLGIPVPDETAIVAQSLDLIAGRPQGVLKLVLTRGVGGRGYAPPELPQAMVVLSWHALPGLEPDEGLTLRWCRLRLSEQPALAGIKHLNRLENVMARAEWVDPDIHEGLLCDAQGRLVGVTAGNVFLYLDGRWLTPRLDRCGVAGIARGWLLKNISEAAEADLTPKDVRDSAALVVCNSVRGVRPARRLEDRMWPTSPAVAELRRSLAVAEPAFSSDNPDSERGLDRWPQRPVSQD
jgi:4-amino-4-deoxychorismate lyase